MSDNTIEMNSGTPAEREALPGAIKGLTVRETRLFVLHMTAVSGTTCVGTLVYFSLMNWVAANGLGSGWEAAAAVGPGVITFSVIAVVLLSFLRSLDLKWTRSTQKPATSK